MRLLGFLFLLALIFAWGLIFAIAPLWTVGTTIFIVVAWRMYREWCDDRMWR